jgi:hypothetical protein
MRAGADWHDHDLIFARFDGTPWRPGYVSRRFRQLAAQAGVPVITLHEGGRQTGVSLMHDAEVRDDIRMREAGHSDRAIHARYNHPLEQAHRQAAEQVAALVRQAGGARHDRVRMSPGRHRQALPGPPGGMLTWASAQFNTGAPPGTRTPNPRIKSGLLGRTARSICTNVTGICPERTQCTRMRPALVPRAVPRHPGPGPRDPSQ